MAAFIPAQVQNTPKAATHRLPAQTDTSAARRPIRRCTLPTATWHEERPPKDAGLVRERTTQRTDAAHVLAAVPRHLPQL